MEKRVASKESKKKMESIENEIYSLREIGRADARHYAVMKEIEAELAQLTPQYLKKLAIGAFTTNTKFYIGDAIPTFFSDSTEVKAVAGSKN